MALTDDVELHPTNDNEWTEARFQNRMDTVSKASANLGKLLLQGWTMLADECEKCHTPLMRLRNTAARCVVCDPLKEETKTPKQTTSKPQHNTDAFNSNNTFGNDEEFEKRMKKSDDTADKIGELLLKGWTLLADHCDQCSTPLMRLRGGKSMCCNCNASDPQTIVPTETSTKEERNVPSKNTIRRNDADVERERSDHRDDYGRYDHPPMHATHPPMHDPHGNHCHYGHQFGPHPACFGFGPKQDQQLRRTLGDIVKTALDKMSAINDRMSRNNNNLRNDIVELNQLMEFLQNVKKFKKQLLQ